VLPHFPFRKAQREKWSRSVNASTVAKSAEPHAPAATVRMVRAHP